MSATPALETRDLTIRFGGHVAVNAVNCAFHPGTLTAIVGPNGAGKTTYFNLISGQLKATTGPVLLGGQDVTGLSASARTKRGMGRDRQSDVEGKRGSGRFAPGVCRIFKTKNNN